LFVDSRYCDLPTGNSSQYHKYQIGRNKMNAKRISGALIASLVIHGIIMLIASMSYITQTEQFKRAVSVEVLQSKAPRISQVRKPVIKPVVQLTVATNGLADQAAQPPKVVVGKPVIKPMIESSTVPETDLSMQRQVSSTQVPLNVPDSLGAVAESLGNVAHSAPMMTSVQTQGITSSSPDSSPSKTPSTARTSSVSHAKLSQSPPLSHTPTSPRWHTSTQLHPPNDAAYHDMFFKGAGTNPFIDTEDDHLSTFAMDVDTGSYSITRRYLINGYLPPPEAVRVEEFINTFDYNYTSPTEGAFAIHIDGAPSKFGEGKRLQLLRIGLQGHVIPSENRKDAILTFVIDVSGSMGQENRLGLVKKALTLLVDQLRPADKVGIVVYGSRGWLLLPHTGIEQRSEILAAINSLEPGGSTNAEEGLRIGYDLAWRNSSVNHINRVILCSDGVANVGRTGPDEILKEIRAYVQKGITLSTIGFGMGNYNDVLMERLANTGDGSYAYIDTLSEAKRIFVENLTGTLQLIAKDAKIQVDFNPEVVSRFRLLGYENRRLNHEQFRDDTVDAGEVGSGHQVTALYEVKLHPDATGKMATVSIRYADADNHKVSEVSEDISVSHLYESFDVAPATFRLAAGVAEFAEILRESYWAKDGSLDSIHQVLKDAFPEIDNEQVVELMYLVNKAISHKAERS
jgi:Ca-activated chloride channel family protein